MNKNTGIERLAELEKKLEANPHSAGIKLELARVYFLAANIFSKTLEFTSNQNANLNLVYNWLLRAEFLLPKNDHAHQEHLLLIAVRKAVLLKLLNEQQKAEQAFLSALDLGEYALDFNPQCAFLDTLSFFGHKHFDCLMDIISDLSSEIALKLKDHYEVVLYCERIIKLCPSLPRIGEPTSSTRQYRLYKTENYWITTTAHFTLGKTALEWRKYDKAIHHLNYAIATQMDLNEKKSMMMADTARKLVGDLKDQHGVYLKDRIVYFHFEDLAEGM